jgi:hypothetical protein
MQPMVFAPLLLINEHIKNAAALYWHSHGR